MVIFLTCLTVMTFVLTLGALKGDRFYGSGGLNREIQFKATFKCNLNFKVNDEGYDDVYLHEEQQPHGPVPPSPTHLQTGNTCEKNYLGFEKKKITHLLFCYPFFEANEKI